MELERVQTGAGREAGGDIDRHAGREPLPLPDTSSGRDAPEPISEPVLLSPGPTRVPQDVREACARPIVLHRSAEFDRVHDEVVERLRRLFRTEGRVVVLPCSGTGALEAAIVNTLSPGDRVLSVVMGLFGARFAAIAAAYGLEVDRLEVPWGAVPAVEDVVARLRGAAGPGNGGGGGYRAVLLTHSETSTGALLPLGELVPAIREAAPETLVLVDMVSSFAAVPVHLDEWGIDVAVTGSQKALMTPPGLGILALGPRALEAVEPAGLPRFTWDLRPFLRKPGDFPYTPAVSLWFGLEVALRRIEAEGEENVYRRHRLLAAMTRAGVRALGLEPLAADEVASPTVTAVPLPEGIQPGEVIRRLREEHGVIVVSAQGPLRGRAFRIGHMGAVQPEDVLAGMQALDAVLGEMLAAGAPGAYEAACTVWEFFRKNQEAAGRHDEAPWTTPRAAGRPQARGAARPEVGR